MIYDTQHTLTHIYRDMFTLARPREADYYRTSEKRLLIVSAAVHLTSQGCCVRTCLHRKIDVENLMDLLGIGEALCSLPSDTFYIMACTDGFSPDSPRGKSSLLCQSFLFDGLENEHVNGRQKISDYSSDMFAWCLRIHAVGS